MIRMAKFREVYVEVKDGIGNCYCPFCEEENSFDLRKTGDWHAFPSCQHMRSARYGNIGEATVVKGFFARFESREA